MGGGLPVGQLVLRGPKFAKKIMVCNEYFEHGSMDPSCLVSTVQAAGETRQDGSMLPCSLHQVLTLPSECRSRNQDTSDQATFFQFSIVQFW